MTRLGLCCQFKEEPIKFSRTTVSYLTRLEARQQSACNYLSTLALSNVCALHQALKFCAQNKIAAFRVCSDLFPCYTHPKFGYRIEALPDFYRINQELFLVKQLAKQEDIRLSFHPDQFVVLNSPRDEVVLQSIKELEYHCVMADLLGADVINIHGGGAYGDKISALNRLKENFKHLSFPLQKKLTLENDDKIYSPEDLLPICEDLKIGFVYDVHHHRCLKDHLTIEQATKLAVKTWSREPLFHISSPKGGWKVKNPKLHSDLIDPRDVPKLWKDIVPLTIEVEAKAKEIAVLQLKKDLLEEGWHF